MTLRTGRRLVVIGVAVGLAIARFAILDATSHSASDTLRPWAIDVIAIAAVTVLVLRALAFAEREVDRRH